MGLNPKKGGNVDLPAPGTRVVARVKDVEGGGVTVEQVRYSPPGSKAVNEEHDPYSGRIFRNDTEARQSVSRDYANNPVTVVREFEPEEDAAE